MLTGIDTSDMAGVKQAVMEAIDYGILPVAEIQDRVNAARADGARWVTRGHLIKALRSLIEDDYVYRSVTWSEVLFSAVMVDSPEPGIPDTKWWADGHTD